MKIASNALQVFYRGVSIGMVTLVCGQVFSVAAQDRSEKQLRFEADRQACLSGTSGQAFEPCMKEAKAVLALRPDAKPSASPEKLQRDSTGRCEFLTGEDRVACAARMRGEGTVSGSIAGGGILRELVTTEVMPSSPQ
jgi:hypothetical protein